MVLNATFNNISAISWLLGRIFFVNFVDSIHVSNQEIKNSTNIRSHIYKCILKLYFYIADVAEWSRALDIRLSDWCCSVSTESSNPVVEDKIIVSSKI
jgi:hypothetical protein